MVVGASVRFPHLGLEIEHMVKGFDILSLSVLV